MGIFLNEFSTLFEISHVKNIFKIKKESKKMIKNLKHMRRNGTAESFLRFMVFSKLPTQRMSPQNMALSVTESRLFKNQSHP